MGFHKINKPLQKVCGEKGSAEYPIDVISYTTHPPSHPHPHILIIIIFIKDYILVFKNISAHSSQAFHLTSTVWSYLSSK